MQIKGKIIVALPEVSGTSQAGKAWRKREYVLETQEHYPKKIAFTVMNERVYEFNLQVGATYTVDVDAESREYNGKWYTTLTAWKTTPA
ncbi:MAG: DUF3127 domain-containing protein [Muribaculaceae bacterium]|uniref:DUF3127 domain-containing protein n=1 Tax=uncultured Muribaculum sp. TaxID=1918613 RepID=UPI0026EB0C3B|nr:DUF3127 domain-containing protein [uncultured Muribaculum sp.]